jgi:hypothetical protein
MHSGQTKARKIVNRYNRRAGQLDWSQKIGSVKHVRFPRPNPTGHADLQPQIAHRKRIGNQSEIRRKSIRYVHLFIGAQQILMGLIEFGQAGQKVPAISADTAWLSDQ